MKIRTGLFILGSLLLTACASSGTSSLATNTYGVTADMFEAGAFQVPNSKLILYIDLPKLRKERDGGDINGGYSFEGNAEQFHVTFFVEPPQGKAATNKDVYQYYWPLASRNPDIDKSTVKMSETDRYVKVEYFYRRIWGGQKISVKNVNYYALVQDRWIDVHVSVGNPTAADNAALANLDNKIAFTVLGVK
ncbi:MAG TPA: hypothetical protein VIU93_01765 [Gallionellaceae bacterium]